MNLYNPRRTNYVNSNFSYLVSADIKEYDIKSAGLNMLIAANAIDKETINYLKSLPKEKRTIVEGKMQKKNKELTKVINEGLIKYRSLFIKMNNIEDKDIISVKKDAFILVNKSISKTQFDNVVFRKKSRYSSYYNIGNLEFYYSKRYDLLDIKGINTDSKIFKKHEKYMIKFLKTLFSLNEVSHDKACEYLKEFAYKYINYKLDKGYYREFNTDSLYRLSFEGLYNKDLASDEVDSKKDINIIYNYAKIIIPLVKLIF